MSHLFCFQEPDRADSHVPAVAVRPTRMSGDSIHLSSITLPKGTSVRSHEKDMTIATVAAPSAMRSDDAAAAPAEAAAAAAPAAAAAAPAKGAAPAAGAKAPAAPAGKK